MKKFQIPNNTCRGNPLWLPVHGEPFQGEPAWFFSNRFEGRHGGLPLLSAFVIVGLDPTIQR